MKTILFEVLSPERAMERAKALLRSGQPDTCARMVFPTAADMAQTLTPSRWRVLEAMTGAGPLGVRELARRVGRDVKAIHNDVTSLVNNGVVCRTGDGKYLFPYDRVHVEFELGERALAA